MRYLVLGSVVLFSAATAHAYTIESPVSEGCHERIAEDVLRFLRSQGLAVPIPAVTDDDNALIADLPFTLPGDMKDMAAVAFLFGVRRPDVQSDSDVDISSLTLVHGNPNEQDNHCLRSPTNDEPSGSTDAIATCRVTVQTYFSGALAGLNADGSVNNDHFDTLKLSLPIRGQVDVKLNSFWVNAGTALHMIEDSVSHTYRDDAVMNITTVLNWVDYVEKDAVEARDGPEHSADLDACVKLDARRQARLELATNASVELVNALIAPTSGDRMQAAQDVFDATTQVTPGCTLDNQWCNAKDNGYKKTACAQIDVSAWSMLAMSVLAFRRFRRR